VIRIPILEPCPIFEPSLANSLWTSPSLIDSKDVVVNIDLSTLIALISDLPNGYIKSSYSQHFLQEQAKEEESKPLLPSILSLFFI